MMSKQVLCRCEEDEHTRWKAAADKEGLSLNEYIRQTMNTATENLLECRHPKEARKIYPWSEFCTLCGARLK